MEDQSRASARTVERLSPGRHGLTREEVAASQRSRLLAAMAEVAAEKGYGATTVADVLKRAKVSRLTFYEHFSDKEHCFAAAYDDAAQGLTELMAAALEGSEGPWDAAQRAVGAYLDALAAQPVLARLFLVEVYAVGPQFLRRRITMQSSIVDMIADLVSASTPRHRLACEALVGAVVSMATARIAVGDIAALTALRVPLGDLMGQLAMLFAEESTI